MPTTSPFVRRGLASLALAVTVQAQLWDQTIDTIYGPVKGFKYFDQATLETYFNVSESNVTAYLGIPYAADTSYDNRWRPPQPREPWNETFDAVAFGYTCPTAMSTNSSEDCLNLNIWTNAASSDAKLPVMVWNQGSDLSSNIPYWYGGGMALKDVILVSFNRRDDVFGYLAHPELNQEGFNTTGHYTSGNYGVLDFLEVLKWVQSNIANFGGNPDRVVIAGQSFGSSQVYHAVNSPLFSGLFHGAISQSGIRYPYDPMLAGLATSYNNMSAALNHGLNYTAVHNVSTIAELRTLSTAELMIGSTDKVNNTWINWVEALSCGYPDIFKPVLDGYVLPSTYLQTLRDGPANDVPLITGNTKDESGASTTTNYTVEQYHEYNTLRYGENLAKRFFELYPDHNNQTIAAEGWNNAARDQGKVGSWAYATQWYESADSDFYTYFWTHAPPGQSEGAFHMSEIMYALNAMYACAEYYPFTDEDYIIADQMSSYWANFAKTLDPNRGNSYTGSGVLARWEPNTNEGKPVVMELGDNFQPQLITSPEKTNFILKYFSQQTPY
ncbi:carboxylesterase [Aspergillus brunneoviolaceus CBS 621.78]|uniref:Carboxylesterase n=1 Tax=Aspergillus brunneoviolaceus CBS 621.78 TaxID=1450534 RepID=A0ACD1G2L3_9EURO|nr:carboxylesterase [Aspergillus brunneoviolaceus CBS 621.78]RAH43432.1 carboxylesterase [Aspergillus brunneoviolaceus CBS 621.78]